MSSSETPTTPQIDENTISNLIDNINSLTKGNLDISYNLSLIGKLSEIFKILDKIDIKDILYNDNVKLSLSMAVFFLSPLLNNESFCKLTFDNKNIFFPFVQISTHCITNSLLITDSITHHMKTFQNLILSLEEIELISNIINILFTLLHKFPSYLLFLYNSDTKKLLERSEGFRFYKKVRRRKNFSADIDTEEIKEDPKITFWKTIMSSFKVNLENFLILFGTDSLLDREIYFLTSQTFSLNNYFYKKIPLEKIRNFSKLTFKLNKVLEEDNLKEYNLIVQSNNIVTPVTFIISIPPFYPLTRPSVNISSFAGPRNFFLTQIKNWNKIFQIKKSDGKSEKTILIEIVEDIEFVIYDRLGTTEECSICYMFFMGGEIAEDKCFSCSNRFHRKCTGKWFNQHAQDKKCPFCRKEFYE